MSKKVFVPIAVLVIGLSVPSCNEQILSMQQRNGSSLALIPEGGATSAALLQFEITANAAATVELEVRSVAAAFTGTATHSGTSVGTTGGNYVATITATLAPGTYKWRARVAPSSGSPTAWQELGTAGNTDFTVGSGTPAPAISVTPSQFETSSLSPVAEGGSIATGSIRVAAAASTTTGSLTLIEIEVRNMNQPLTGQPTVVSALSGSSYNWFTDVPLANGGYHWQARVTNSAGQNSGWVEFATPGNTDFIINTNGTPSPSPSPAPAPAPAPSPTGDTGGSGGSSKGRCGLMGVEAVLVFAALRILRKKA